MNTMIVSMHCGVEDSMLATLKSINKLPEELSDSIDKYLNQLDKQKLTKEERLNVLTKVFTINNITIFS